MDMVGKSSSRVNQHTADEIDAQIRRDMEMRVRGYATQPKSVISERLRELDREWDVERCLQTGASFFTLFGTTMGATVSKKWLILPCAVMGFFLQHAVQGWCPPLIVFRKLGVRTVDEINEERYALKALRGDFASIPASPDSAPAEARTAFLNVAQ